MNSLYQTYTETLIDKLKKELSINNSMAVPKMIKIVINCGLGEALKDKKVIESMARQLSVITGQKPRVAKARKAISTFKLREGDAIGLKVTLRGNRMYDFLLKLTSIALPRVRDFRGVSLSGFDGNGNYTLGLSEQTIFPDLDYGTVDHVRGFEVTFVTNASSDHDAQALLTALGVPFAKDLPARLAEVPTRLATRQTKQVDKHGKEK